MDNIWISRTGGVFTFLLGIFELLSSFFIIICFILVIFGIWVYSGFILPIYDSWLEILIGIFIALILLLIISGALGIIGGYFAIKRKKWKFVVSSSIVAGIMAIIFGMFLIDQFHISMGYLSIICLVGVASPVLIILSKRQFKFSLI